MTRGYLNRTGEYLDHPAWWDEYRHFRSRGRTYYVFVEEVLAPTMGNGVDGPDGRVVATKRHPVFSESPIRFRSSGLLINDFHDVVDAFEELDPERIEPGQRVRRKKDIQEHLEHVPLPVLDLFVQPKHPDLPTMRAMLRPSSWHILGVSRSDRLPMACPVLIGAPEIADDPYAFSFLTFAGAVPPEIEVRLRDIFSLAHIPDAEFNVERGEDILALPPDLPPDEPSDKRGRVDLEAPEEDEPEDEKRRNLPGMEA